MPEWDLVGKDAHVRVSSEFRAQLRLTEDCRARQPSVRHPDLNGFATIEAHVVFQHDRSEQKARGVHRERLHFFTILSHI
jgi:hypothetical protein